MNGRREPSGLSLGCNISFPSLNAEATRKPPLPSKCWYFHTLKLQLLRKLCVPGGKKAALCTLGYSNNSQPNKSAWHLQYATDVCGRTVPDAEFKTL